MKTLLIVSALSVAVIVATLQSPHAKTVAERQGIVPDPRPIQALGRSHISLLTDLLWVRTTSEIISLKTPANGLALLQWCDLVATLDPRFEWSYLVGGLMGVVDVNGTSFNVAEANHLLQLGLERRPDRIELALFLSFNQLMLQHDPAAAGRTLQQAAQRPGAPTYLAPLSLRLLSQGKDFKGAEDAMRALTGSLLDDDSRALLEQRSKEVERDRGLASINDAVQRYHRERQHFPSTLIQLSLEGFLPTIPVDPLGGTFELQPDGSVIATSGSPLAAHNNE